jgi:hypothetical protein
MGPKRDDASRSENSRAAKHKNDTQASVKRVARYAVDKRAGTGKNYGRTQRNNRREV